MFAHQAPACTTSTTPYVVDLVVILSLFLSVLVGNLPSCGCCAPSGCSGPTTCSASLKLFPAVRRNEELLTAALDLAACPDGVVAGLRHPVRGQPEDPGLRRRALLHRGGASTTGFGDVIALGSTGGELLSVVLMIVGSRCSCGWRRRCSARGKVRHPCPACVAQRHDADAVHCKACGLLLNI